MSLFDTFTQALGAAAPGGSPETAGALDPVALLQHLGPWLGPQGLGGLVQAFEQGGLGAIVQSWVGTGANLPVSADQLQQVLGDERLGALAGAMGLDGATVARHLSQHLPALVDQLSPGGRLPDGALDAGALSGLAGMAAQWLGGATR